VLRYSPQGAFESQAALLDASQKLFGLPGPPVFDLSNCGVIFSFGARFDEPWLSLGAGSPLDRRARIGGPLGSQARLLQFEARRSEAAAYADEWVPIRPGCEAVLAQTLAGLATGTARQGGLREKLEVDLSRAAEQTGVSARQLIRLARLFSNAPQRLALPGGPALASANGLQAAQWILALNLAGQNPGHPSGLALAPGSPLFPGMPLRPASAAEMGALAENLRMGRIKALFIHGVDPLRLLPEAFGLREALMSLERVISFASFADNTSHYADAILPDHLQSESWGYQISLAEADLGRVLAIKPDEAPRWDTRAAADVLLAGARRAGGTLSARIGFRDELDFLRSTLSGLNDHGGVYKAADIEDFWQLWLEQGGWRRSNPARFPAIPFSSPSRLPASPTKRGQGTTLDLLIYPEIHRRPGGQSPTQSAEIHPLTAARNGFTQGELVKVVSGSAEILRRLELNPALHPAALAIAWEPGLASRGRSSSLASANPLDLCGLVQNDSGELVSSGIPVKIVPMEI
jgi:anaerobic selenocysteine-containing dehydrogenase